MEQFFGKTTWRVFFGLMLATLVGFAFFRIPSAHVVALTLILIAGFVTYWFKPELTFILVFAELFGFSHGRLFAYELGGFLFTGRMALFVGIMLAWGIKWLLRKATLKAPPTSMFAWSLFAVALVIGLAVGLANNNVRDVLDDFNGYVYVFYLLPLVSIKWDGSKRYEIIQTIVGASIWISVFSLALLYTFTHLSNDVLVFIYKLVRDARIGEITLMEGGYWRVFMQSQIVLIASLLFGLSLELELSRKPALKKFLIIFLMIVISGLIISLSRSFWIGLVVSIPFLIYLHSRIKNKFEMAKKVGVWFADVLLALVVLAVVSLIAFPVPSRVVDLRETFSNRTTELGDAAISSRWNLLPVMLEEMHAHPSLGSGFGKELAFVSDDPRAREIYSDGKWRTYKFEWGWIDLWVKMGAMGFFSFVIIFIAYDKLLRESGELPFWLVCALRALLLALVVTNFFSPYLNHPLGLGILLFVTLFLEQEKKTERPIIERIQNKLPTAKLASQTPTVSAYEENT